MNYFKKGSDKISPAVKRGFAVALAAVLIFCAGYAGGSFSNIKSNIESGELYQQVLKVAGSQNNQPPAQPVTPATEPASPVTEPAAPDTTVAPPVVDTTVPAEPDTTKAPDNGGSNSAAPSTPEEIISYFNESANKIKSTGATVTRNYEHLTHNEEYLEVPGILKGIGKSLIGTFLKNNDTPETYSDADKIAKYPVQDKDYVSKATAADLKSAACTDDGSNYVITLEFYDAVDPGDTGIGAAFNTMKSEDVMAAASIVKEFSVNYYNCKIVAKVDKATGNMVETTYTMPMIMSVKAMGVDAKVGMTFEHNYTIAY